MSVYAVGDVQGCFEPLQRLLKQVEFDRSRDRLWLTGDLVNRGPASLEVLRFVRSLGDAAVVVLGNHDLHLLAVASGVREPWPDDTLHELLGAPDSIELLSWLREQPLAHHDPVLGFIMTHAGIPPQWSVAETRERASEVERALRGAEYRDLLANMYGNEPSTWSDDLQGSARLRVITNYLTRMRFCGPRGELDLGAKQGPEAAPPGMLPWFRHPQRKTANDRVIFGHWAALAGKANTANVFALDTGCVYGGALTLLNLESAQLTSCGCAQSNSWKH